NAVNSNYFLGAFQALPFLNPSEYNGTWQSANDLLSKYGVAGGSPYMLLDKRRTFTYGQNEFKMLANGSISYKLSDKLTIGNQTGVDYQTINQNSTTKYDAFNERYFAVAGQEFFGRANEIFEERMIFNSNTRLRYETTFADVHKFSAGLYMEYIKAHFKSRSINKRGFDPIFWSDGSTGWIDPSVNYQLYAPTGAIGTASSGLFSYFGVASYDYDRRYGLDATLRRDASFRFTNDNR